MSSFARSTLFHCFVRDIPNKSLRNLVAAAALTGLVFPAPARAVEYSFGEVSGAIDTILSAGASMRTSERDCSNIGGNGGLGNGGCQKFDAMGLQNSFPGSNVDDGNLNYGQWDVFSGAMKATTEIQSSWRNYGAFVRGSAFFDPIVDNTDFRDLNSAARSEVSQNAKLLDYFVSGSFEVGGNPLELKFGNQVISWGESTFIQNGLSQINPIDVAAVRKPGSELKEFFTPILAARASLGLPGNFSLDSFYQFKANEIIPDPSGTFFSSADFIGRGSQPLRGGSIDPQGDDRYNPFLIAAGLDVDTVWQSDQAVNYPAVNIERANDKKGSNGGEFGFALRYFDSEFNQGTEFGLFFMRLHSRLPIIELSTAIPAGARDNVTALSNAFAPGEIGTAGQAFAGANPGAGASPGPSRNAYDVGQTLCNVIGAGFAGGALLASNGIGSANTPFAISNGVGNFGGGLPDDLNGDGAVSALDDGLFDVINGRFNLALPGGYTNCNHLATLLNRNSASLDRTIGAVMANTQTFRLEYPEDIEVVGLSLSTTVSGIAVQAEATYRHDQPFNYAFNEMGALSNDLDGQTRFRTRAPQAGTGQVISARDGAVPLFEPTFLVGYNDSAALAGQTTFADVARAEEIGLGLPVGSLGSQAPREITASMAARAAAGTLSANDADVIAAANRTIDTGIAVGAISAAAPRDVAARAAMIASTANFYGHIAVDSLNVNGRTFSPGGIDSNTGTGQPPSGIILPASAIVVGSPTDIQYSAPPSGVPVPQTRSSALTAADVSSDGFIKPAFKDVFTAQTTLTSLLFASNPLIEFAGANGGVLVTEIGMVMVPGLSTADGIAGGNTRGLANALASQTYQLNGDMQIAGGYATRFSWGAQGLMILNYNRAFGSPINLSPSVAWKWDIGGNTPATFGNYQAERKALTIGVSGTYLANWAASVSWTSNFGPDAPLNDRDFAAATVSYAF
ncbi:MAG: DUF1302 family protein [Alphaproteobacteria bacterium]